MTATDRQVYIAMRERRKGKTQEQAAAKANLKSRQTVAKYEKLGQLPGERQQPRQYRTRRDPFAEDWPTVVEMLTAAPSLQPKTLFDWLCEREPGRYKPGQLRTLQRKIAHWKGVHLQKLASLPQIRYPGELMQTDGTSLTELDITLNRQPFPHMLMHSVLPYSNWEWGRVVQSETLAALRLGIQSSLVQLGHVPETHQTDHSSAATRQVGQAEEIDENRTFTEGYLALLAHFGMDASTTHVASPDENGDVEALHGTLKRALEQHLLLRGSRDFDSLDAYEAFLFDVMRRRNGLRQEALADELAVMRPLTSAALETRRRLRVRVAQTSLIRVEGKHYSVPTGLIGRWVNVWIGEWDIDVYLGTEPVERLPRLVGQRKSRVNYRHVIDSLLRKPGGFRHYRYRDDLFPTLTFRRAWERLNTWLAPRQADIHYLQILKLAAKTLECDVDAALSLLLETGERWRAEDVRQLLTTEPAPPPPLESGKVELSVYDALLRHSESSYVHA
jgi:DNA-binding XRE family transcriptional regulator